MLTANHLRDDALACFRAAVESVEPEELVRRFLEGRPEVLDVPGSVRVVAVGKAAGAMARGVVGVLEERLGGGVAIVPAGSEAEVPLGIQVFGGGHPVPDAVSVAGSEAALAVAEGLGDGDLLLCLISGGGSALMTLPPPGIFLEDVTQTTTALLRAGATIREINCVRKHIDSLKGGRLARAAQPARTVALVLSDVVGDPLSTIASGPVSPDTTTFQEALAVLERLQLLRGLPPSIHAHLQRGVSRKIAESVKPADLPLQLTEAHIVGNNRIAVEAAGAEARRRGYQTLLLSTLITGEARQTGRVLAGIGAEILRSSHPLASPACLLAAGETTVTVTGTGIGGRNQELALGAAIALDELINSAANLRKTTPDEVKERILILSGGTDGVDGPTGAAGAFATETTVRRAALRGIDAYDFLADNDSYNFFRPLGDLLITGPTGTNVMDLQILMTR